jgi:nucleoside-diphosphate-sugar epimerase
MSGRNQLEDTLAATRGVLAAMSDGGIRNLVAVSSIAVLDYPSLPPGSVVDEGARAGSDDSSMGTYAQMKSRQEALVEAWSRGEGRVLGLIRPGLVYDEDRLSSAHAGALGLAALHAGQVPVVHVDSVAEALVRACSLRSSATIHLVDDALPSQAEYLRELRARGGRLRIPLPWRLYAVLMGMLRSLLSWSFEVPDGLRRHSIAARQKPFRFSNEHAKAELRWLPMKGLCSERGAST